MFDDSKPVLHSDEWKDHFHVGMACLSVGSLTFLLDTMNGSIEKSDRFFVANWTWQFLMLAAGSLWVRHDPAEQPTDLLGRVFGFVSMGVAINVGGFMFAGVNPASHFMDCVFQMWFVIAATVAAGLTLGLKALLRGAAFNPGMLAPAVLLSICAWSVHSRSAMDQVQQLERPVDALVGVVDQGYAQYHHLNQGHVSVAWCVFLPLGMTGVGLLAAMLAVAGGQLEQPKLGWGLLAYTYACRILLPCEHALAFYTHLINLFIVAVVVGQCGLHGARGLYQYSKHFPWLLLLCSFISEGAKQNNIDPTDLGKGGQLADRLPYNCVEALFVVCYFAAAENVVLDAEAVAAAKDWAMLFFLIHPTIWRLLPPVLAYPVLLLGTAMFAGHAKRKAYVPLA